MASTGNEPQVERSDTAWHRRRGLAHDVIGPATAARLRTIARFWAVLAIVVFVPIASRLGTPHSPEYASWESTAQLGVAFVVALALLAAWRREGLGGAIGLVGAIGLGVLAALQYHPYVALLVTLLFITPAVLFLLAWQHTRTLLQITALASVVFVVMIVGGAAANAVYQTGYGPAHPQSARERLPDSPVTWVWSGAVTEASATVVARVPNAERVRLLVDVGSADRAALAVDPTVDGDVYRFEVGGLDADTDYEYAVEVDGSVDTIRNGHFRTFAQGPWSFTIAIGSCARSGSNGEVYETIRAAEPDLYLVDGDLYYADIGRNEPELFIDAYEETLTEPAQAALYQGVPVAYVWDDHDYGPNDAGGDSPSREAAQQTYRRLVPHYPLPAGEGEEPIYQAFTMGRVRFILTDLRSARSPNGAVDDGAKTMLGAAQRAWLEEELLRSSREHALVVLVSSVPWIADTQAGADHWGGFARERAELAEFLAEHGIDNLAMVAGDAHMLAIDDGSHGAYDARGMSGFPVMHAGALDRPGSFKGGPYSEGAHPGGGQFATMTVVDDGSELSVTWRGLDWTGNELLGYSFSLPAEETP